MKLYYYNNQTLQFKRVKYFPKLIKLAFMATTIFLLMGISTQKNKPNTEYEKVLIVKKENAFSEESLQKSIAKYNFRFPHIVYAQSMLETHHFRSGIFMENHNLFGMKEAVVRLNMAKGTNRGHAYYDNWEESLLDYALWYATYADKCRTEEQMFQLLGGMYAEDTLYVPKLKWLIEEKSLKELF